MAYRKFCESLSLNSCEGSVWRCIRAFSRARQGSRDDSNNNHVDFDRFLQAFEKVAPRESREEDAYTCDFLENVAFPPVSVPGLSPANPFSSNEYFTVISSLKEKSASGPDLISNRIILKFPTESPDFSEVI